MGEDSENSGLFRRLQEPLMSIELEVQAVVDVVNISVGEIMGLRPGDIHSAEYAWARTGGALDRRKTEVHR